MGLRILLFSLCHLVFNFFKIPWSFFSLCTLDNIDTEVVIMPYKYDRIQSLSWLTQHIAEYG